MKRQLYPGWHVIGLTVLLAAITQPCNAQPAYAHIKQVSRTGEIQPRTITLKDALKALKGHYGVDIVFGDRTVDPYTITTDLVDYKLSVEKNLLNVLRPTGLKYKRLKNGSYAIISEKALQRETEAEQNPADIPSNTGSANGGLTESNLVATASPIPTARNVTGEVLDEKGEGLPGVSIIIKGKTRGTVTDQNGRFSLETDDEGERLIFSYVGYLTRELELGSSTSLRVVLELDNKLLQEVIVVGYGTQKKADVTGAISSISERVLREVPVTNAQQMLQGRAAGVYVVQDSYRPGAGVTVQIRGRRSFSAGNDPLYVVDGIPISGGFNDINPNDIVSMDVLKDASATAIYGSRGANGVVVITTKRGAPGRISVSYNGFSGVSSIFRYADMMNGPEFTAYRREAAIAAGKYNTDTPEASDKILFDPIEQKSILEGRSTDFQRLVVRKGMTNNHNLSISGGTESTRFNVSMGYFKDKGIIPGQDFTRFTTRINLDQKFGRIFKIGTSMLGTYSLGNGADVNIYGSGLQVNPLGVPYDANGKLIFRPTNDGLITNPLSELVPGAIINTNKRFRLFTSLYGEAELMEGLTFRMNFGPDLIKSNTGNFRGSLTNARQGGISSATVAEDFIFNYTWENILNYKKKLADRHSVEVTGLYSVQTQTQEKQATDVQGLPVESLEFYNLGQASIINSVSSDYSKWSILSYMGRVNYGFDDRFLVTLTGRFDGSSRFAQGKQWGFFPSVALGWNVINEQFLKSNRTISNLKLRASYGQTGNTGIDPYQTQGLVTRAVYDFDGKPAYGYRPGTIRNNDLKWETTTSANVGLDFGIFNDRVTGSAEVYRSVTKDLLLPRVLPTTSGFASILQNVGSTQNVGFEFSLSSQNIRPQGGDGLSWTSDLNFFTNREKILELSQGKVDDIGNSRFIGQPISVFYDYERTGIWQLGEDQQALQFASKVGQNKINDRNGNGIIDPDDRTILGTSVPKFSGGLTNRFAYKGFDLSIFLFARFGSLIQSELHQGAIFAMAGRYNNYNVDYWTKDNPTNAYPQPNLNQERPLFNTTLTYFDGSFIKARNISLGYNVKPALTNRIKAQSIRVYGNVQNPFMYAPYVQKHNGIDPEVPKADTPLARLFVVGLNITI